MSDIEVRENSGIKALLDRRKLISDLKLAIATKCEHVIQSPESNIGSLREMVKSLNSSRILSLRQIRSLLIASLCVVFKDILPDYKLRQATEQEKLQPTKKETKKLRFFEESLLLNYRKYVDLISTVLTGKSLATDASKHEREFSKHHWNESDRTMLLKCACQLFEAHPNFNYGLDLLKVLVTYLNSSDSTICKAIHSLCRKRHYIVRPIVTKTLACVRIGEINPNSFGANSEKRDRDKLSRKERKNNKLEKKHEKEMAETRAAQTREEKIKLPSRIEDCLHCVLLASKILANSSVDWTLETDPRRFYAHLYSLLGRLGGSTSSAAENPNFAQNRLHKLTTDVYLHSSTPAAQAVRDLAHRQSIMSKKTAGGEHQSHPSETVDEPSRLECTNLERTTDVLLECLGVLLIKRKHTVSANRVLAFVKRLISAALNTSDSACVAAMLVKVCQLFKNFPRCEVLFDLETELGGSYDAEVDDPDLCRPASACLWELNLLKDHSSPQVRSLASAALLWGTAAHTANSTDAASKLKMCRLAQCSLSLDELISLSPADCRNKLSSDETAFIESHRPSVQNQHSPNGLRKRRTPSIDKPSKWLVDTLVSVDLNTDEEFIKASKITKMNNE